MKQDKIIDALGYLPDDILAETDAVRQKNEKVLRHRKPYYAIRRVLLAAVLTALLTMGGLAAYQRWHMPQNMEGFQGDIIEQQEQNVYSVPTVPEGSETTAVTEPERLTDEWFINQAKQVLEIVDQDESEATKISVTRQRDLLWTREEVEVSWHQNDTLGPQVKFDAKSGYLIGITSFGDPSSEGTPMSEADALKIAQDFYDRLPYAKGYEYHYLAKYDDHAWSFHFDKPVQVQLWGETVSLHNSYEEVRIVVDPCTGTFELSNCFYVPLLDDHEPNAEPLTQDQAVERVMQQDLLVNPLERFELKAEIGICLPRPGQMAFYNGTTDVFANYPYCDVTRLGWILTFVDPPDEDLMFPGETQICVDLYTGEILSIDTTG